MGEKQRNIRFELPGFISPFLKFNFFSTSVLFTGYLLILVTFTHRSPSAQHWHKLCHIYFLPRTGRGLSLTDSAWGWGESHFLFEFFPDKRKTRENIDRVNEWTNARFFSITLMHLIMTQRQKCCFLGSNVAEYMRNEMCTFLCGGGFVSSPLSSPNFSGNPGTRCSSVFGQVCSGFPGVSLPCWAENLWLSFSMKELPVGMLHTGILEHLPPGMIFHHSVIPSDKSDGDNPRWSEKLHRRQRCSNNGNISNIITPWVTEKRATGKAPLKANT